MSCRMSWRGVRRSRAQAWKWDSAQTTSDALTAAERYAKGMQDDYVSTEHILLASPIRWKTKPRLLWPDQGCDLDRAQVGARSQRVTSADPDPPTSRWRNMTRPDRHGAQRQARPGHRADEEIRRVVQILSRRSKNNPALIGDPGVGKTAIVEGLAHHQRGRARRSEEAPLPAGHERAGGGRKISR